jgi:hypothetical protein
MHIGKIEPMSRRLMLFFRNTLELTVAHGVCSSDAFLMALAVGWEGCPTSGTAIDRLGVLPGCFDDILLKSERLDHKRPREIPHYGKPLTARVTLELVGG